MHGRSRNSVSEHRFSSSYHEDVTLKGGDRIFLKTITSDDKQSLLAGFERLSPESRFKRFFSYKSSLSGNELRYLTETDGETHLALAAGHIFEDGRGEGIGVARFVRLEEDPEAAEPALAIIDEGQGKGVGRRLFGRLMAAARERRIKRFECTVMADNEPMLRLLYSYPDAHMRTEGSTAYVTVPVTRPANSHESTLSWRRLLGWLSRT